MAFNKAIFVWDLIYSKWYRDNKDKDPKVVIRDPDGKVIEVVNEKQIQDTLKSSF